MRQRHKALEEIFEYFHVDFWHTPSVVDSAYRIESRQGLAGRRDRAREGQLYTPGAVG